MGNLTFLGTYRFMSLIKLVVYVIEYSDDDPSCDLSIKMCKEVLDKKNVKTILRVRACAARSMHNSAFSPAFYPPIL